jgi:hypothetical protein
MNMRNLQGLMGTWATGFGVIVLAGILLCLTAIRPVRAQDFTNF